MIICAHKDCGYKHGWTHTGGDENKYIDGQYGEFYEIKADYKTVTARRGPDYHIDTGLLGCPKCKRLFIYDGEVYLERD